LRNCFIAVALVLVILIGLIIVMGHGESPLALTVEPQRDVLVYMPSAFRLLDATSSLALRSGALNDEQRKALDTIHTCRSYGLGLFFPSFETSAAVDLPADGGASPSGIVAFRYGRLARFITFFTMGGKNPYQQSPSGERFWRFGTTGAAQFGETYKVTPKPGVNPFEKDGDCLLAMIARPERIEGRMRVSASPVMDQMHIPWPMTEIKAVLKNAGEKGFVLHGDASFRADKLAGLAGETLSAGPLPSLAERFITNDTVLAAGWVSPSASEVTDMMSEFLPDDKFLRTNYTLGMNSLRNELASSAGPRAAVVVYTQRDVKMAPGYSGVLFAQELTQPERINAVLPGLLRSITGEIVEETGAAPARYPYFVYKSPAPGLPKAYVYHCEMMRPSECYQPVILVYKDALIYASSPGTLAQALNAGGTDDEKTLIKVRFMNTDRLGWEQMEKVYGYLKAEYLATRNGKETLSDATNYDEAFKQVKDVLSLFDSVEISVTGNISGTFSFDVRLHPGAVKKE
jgi:hypothetical protein